MRKLFRNMIFLVCLVALVFPSSTWAGESVIQYVRTHYLKWTEDADYDEPGYLEINQFKNIKKVNSHLFLASYPSIVSFQDGIFQVPMGGSIPGRNTPDSKFVQKEEGDIHFVWKAAVSFLKKKGYHWNQNILFHRYRRTPKHGSFLFFVHDQFDGKSSDYKYPEGSENFTHRNFFHSFLYFTDGKILMPDTKPENLEPEVHRYWYDLWDVFEFKNKTYVLMFVQMYEGGYLDLFRVDADKISRVSGFTYTDPEKTGVFGNIELEGAKVIGMKFTIEKNVDEEYRGIWEFARERYLDRYEFVPDIVDNHLSISIKIPSSIDSEGPPETWEFEGTFTHTSIEGILIDPQGKEQEVILPREE